MLDVEYIRYVVGPSNEIKIWTLSAGHAQRSYRFPEDGRIEPGSEEELRLDYLEENIEAWIREFKSFIRISIFYYTNIDNS